jgi:hypothetical protein
MKWINIKGAFLTSIESLVPESQQKFLKGFSELEQEMKSRFPEGLKNPALISDTEWTELLKKFRDYNNLSPESSSQECVRALMRIRKMIGYAPGILLLNENLNATKFEFDRASIVYCFNKWLAANGWNNINSIIYKPNSVIDITAKKSKRNYAFIAVPSAGKNTNGLENPLQLNPSFNKNLFASVFRLINNKIQKPAEETGIIIPADMRSIQLTMPYVPHIHKLEIRIFAITSAKKVERL